MTSVLESERTGAKSRSGNRATVPAVVDSRSERRVAARTDRTRLICRSQAHHIRRANSFIWSLADKRSRNLRLPGEAAAADRFIVSRIDTSFVCDNQPIALSLQRPTPHHAVGGDTARGGPRHVIVDAI